MRELLHRDDALTVVMYHYVRPIPDQAGFSMKGLTPGEFDGQLDYIERHYNVCSIADVVAAALGERPLPPRPCVLTFDDGLAEHAAEVWPRLSRRGWSGTFFASAAATLERRLLDVHRIHMLLAGNTNVEQLAAELMHGIDAQAGGGVPSAAGLWARFGVPSRFDGPSTNFVKRVLQKGLPANVRRQLLDTLFARYVGQDGTELADAFYLRLEDLQAMVDDGMEVGGHGIRHVWLDRVSAEERAYEIHGTLDLLRRVHRGRMPDRWCFAYPFGAYDQHTIDMLLGARCAAAVTVHVDLAQPGTSILELPRIDANDLPRSGLADPVEWTRQARPDIMSALDSSLADP